MNEEKLKIIFSDMLMIYVKCIRHGIATQLETAWSEMPNGWYAHFLKLDRENAKKSNAGLISEEVEGMHEFDFQACNKTLQYIKEVREVIYNNAGITKALASRINPYYQSLISFRNTYVGHENYTPQQLENYRDEHNNAVEKMHLILQNAFRNTLDPENEEGKTFFEQFEVLRMDYNNECQSKAYFLSEHIDLNKYDAAKFLPVCKKLGIDTDIVDDKYIFYTYNLRDTLVLLRNFMAKNGDGRLLDADSVVVTPIPKKPVWPILAIATGIILIVALIFGVSSLLNGNSDKTPDDTDKLYSVIQSQIKDNFPAASSQENQETVSTNDKLSSQQTTTSQSGNSAQSAQSSQTSTSSQVMESQNPINPEKNQIPSKYDSKVLALQYADEGRIRLMTLETTVGGYVSPPSAATWGTGTIYSQNTDVAIADGLLVRGVSVGETYIAYESDGLCVVYRVVVK